MTDRRNRVVLAVVGLLLFVGGGLSACLGAGLFGTARSNQAVFDHTVIRWWDQGGWISFALVGAVGALALVLGAFLSLSQLPRNDGRQRTPNVTFRPTEGTKGETTLRSPALSHGLEADLERIPDVDDAMVGLFGPYPTIELRAVLTVGDRVDLDQLPAAVHDVLGRMESTTGVRPDPVQVTIRFKSSDRERQLQ